MKWAWVAATVGALALFLLGSCETPSANRRSAQTLWQRVSVVYYHQGLAAAPVLTTNADGTLREERRYEPFGQPIDANVGGSIGPVDFRREAQNGLGKLTDAATGWSYHGARWMQPQTARWTVPDPVVMRAPGDSIMAPWDLNPYQYAGQNPLLFWDPDGWAKAIYFVGIPTKYPVKLTDPRTGADMGTWTYNQKQYGAAVKKALSKEIGEKASDIDVVPVTSNADYAKKAAAIKNPGDYEKGGYVGHGRLNVPKLNPGDAREGNEKKDVSAEQYADPMKRFHNIKEQRFYGCRTHESGFAPELKELMPDVDIKSVRGREDLKIRPDDRGGIKVELEGDLQSEKAPTPKEVPAELDPDISGGEL